MNFSFPCEIYHCTIFVSIGKPDAAMRKFLKCLEKHGYNHKSYEEDERKLSGSIELLGVGNLLIWLEELPTDGVSHGVMSHEIFHAAVAILRRVNMPLTQDSEEAFSYLVGWITRKIFDKILKKETVAA